MPVFYRFVKIILKCYLVLVHRIKIVGSGNIPAGSKKLIIISNHASLLDGLILWAYLDLPLKIIVNRGRAQEWFLRPFMQNDYTVLIDTMNPYALKGIIEKVAQGLPLLIFPEGRVTRTGNLMRVYEGTGFVAYMTGAEILPIYLGNTYSTIFSKKKKGKKIFAPITMTIGKVREPLNLEHIEHRKRKREAADRIYQILCDMYYEVHNRPSTLGCELVRICKKNGARIAYKDLTGNEVSYRKALMGAFVLGRYFSRLTEKNIGVLLPNLTLTALIFMGLQIFNKVAVFLNYSAGPAALTYTMDLADLKTIVTSRQFLDRIKLAPDLLEGKEVIFVEDLKDVLGMKEKMAALMRSIFPSSYTRPGPAEPKETAVILFTSGSEDLPKGVCLSHENIISNIHQALARIDVGEDDYFLSALPIFHSFGLTIGAIMPLFAGAKTFLYVSPLHYRVIPEIIYDEGCTILMGTNTFLNGYGRKAHPYDFRTLRYVYCGAEALNDTVFEKYAKTFGVRVMSGYGATECAPILTMNSALEHEYWTVGKVLSGIEYKLVPTEGIDSKEGTVGRLFVKGKNIMQGYLKNEKANHKFLVEDEGWYDTGDIVEKTAEGFLKIVGRLKRFSKISGEMISLAAVEEGLTGLFGERKEAVIMAVEDERKGEKLVLVTNYRDAELKVIRERLRKKGFSDLACPRDIVYMKEIPKLGTGKVDYVKLKKLLVV